MNKTKITILILIVVGLIVGCIASTILLLKNKESLTEFLNVKTSTTTQEVTVNKNIDIEGDVYDSNNDTQDLVKALYEDEYFTIQLEKEWKSEKLYTGDILVSKGDYWMLIKPHVIVTGGGYGYPYDGVCIFESSNPVNLVNKLIRTDNYLPATEHPTLLTYCGIDELDTEIKNVWLGSRIAIIDDTIPALISKDSYFNNDTPKHPSGFIEIMYGHESLSFKVFSTQANDTIEYTDINSPQTQQAISDMDKMIKTLEIKPLLNE